MISGRHPTVLGKPHKPVFDVIVKRLVLNYCTFTVIMLFSCSQPPRSPHNSYEILAHIFNTRR